jgi:phosphotriesterase-related protein
MQGDSTRGFTRRDVFGLLGAGVGLGAIAGLTEEVGFAQNQAPGWLTTRSTKPSFPKGAVIRTLLKDVPPDQFPNGATLMHEHLIGIGNYASPPDPKTCGMPCAPPVKGPAIAGVDLLVDELKASAGDGVVCIVNSTTRLMTDENMRDLRDLATRSGMHIVAGGGFFREAYPKELMAGSEQGITDWLVKHATSQRWGAFGEIGTSMPTMEADERKFLIALAAAQLRTNLPIFTHIPHQSCPKCAVEQLELLTSRGVHPRSIAIGHMSTVKLEDDPDGDSLKTVAKAGAFIAFDTIGHQMATSHIPERMKVQRVLQILEAGYEDNLMFSADFAQGFNLKANWGNGYSSVIIQFVPKLKHAGVKDNVLRKILVDNPRRFLACMPKV